jgi:nitrogen fixation-related uncharacterized protein
VSFYALFLLYVSLGVVASVVLFFWAVRTDQFRDQQRARYLPLDGVDVLPPTAGQRHWPREIVATVAVAFLGLAVLLGLALYSALTLG